MRLIARTLNQLQSPITSADNLIREYVGNRPLLNLTQGVPNYPTAPVIVNHITNVVGSPDGGKYTPRPGLETLRTLVAHEISQVYRGFVRSDHVLITAGCNQAFCLAISALADQGDEIIIPVPYYFNHDMWLRLDRLSPIYLYTAPHFMPDPDKAEALITDKTRAIVLVTPSNPTGLVIPPPIIQAFADLAKIHDIMLIIDETYRVFRSVDERPHALFEERSWGDNVISLHSFSKEFAIPGYRVGAAIAHPDMIVEMLKLADCISICAPRVGQEAVIAGLTSAKDWRHDRVREIRKKQMRFEAIFADRPGGFELCTAGAFFGWVKHPLADEVSDKVVRRLLLNLGILVLPGTIFTPNDEGYLRFSFGNLSLTEIDELGARLREFT